MALYRCSTCRSYHQLRDRSSGAAIMGDNGKAQGECHRFPPTIFPVITPAGMQARSQMPIVNSDNWCGEYIPMAGVQE